MPNFCLSDKSYIYGDILREVRIQVNNILVVMTLEKYNDIWGVHFYNFKKDEPNQYIISTNISQELAFKIIKEAREYQNYLYGN